MSQAGLKSALRIDFFVGSLSDKAETRGVCFRTAHAPQHEASPERGGAARVRTM